MSHSSSVAAFSLTTRSLRSRIPMRRATGIISPVAASYRDARKGASPQVTSKRRLCTYCTHAGILPLQTGNCTGVSTVCQPWGSSTVNCPAVSPAPSPPNQSASSALFILLQTHAGLNTSPFLRVRCCWVSVCFIIRGSTTS